MGNTAGKAVTRTYPKRTPVIPGQSGASVGDAGESRSFPITSITIEVMASHGRSDAHAGRIEEPVEEPVERSLPVASEDEPPLESKDLEIGALLNKLGGSISGRRLAVQSPQVLIDCPRSLAQC